MELSFMRHMEEIGYVLGETLLYESLRVPYRVGRGRERCYIIDFYAPDESHAWEVKPTSRVGNKKNLAKASAARQVPGLTYSVVTEQDFKVLDARSLTDDPDVKFDTRSLRRINRKRKRRRRRH